MIIRRTSNGLYLCTICHHGNKYLGYSPDRAKAMQYAMEMAAGYGVEV